MKTTQYNKQLGRIVQVNDDFQQITIEDQRFYKKADVYYPSVTYILSCWPKGKGFENWLKSNGDESDMIARESADAGTKVHQAIENLLKGYKLDWFDKQGNAYYSESEWKMILAFQDFWTMFKPTLIHSELHIFSNVHIYAGTVDLIIEMNGRKWILDIKTSKQLHFTYDLQLASYAEAWNEHNPDDKVENYGVLWLNAKTRKPTEGKIQGKGWQLQTPEFDHVRNMEIFKSVHDIFKVVNPKPKPITEDYPNSINLGIEDTTI